MATTSRGGNLDDDFVTSENDQGYLHNDQGHPHNSDDVNMSRLSDVSQHRSNHDNGACGIYSTLFFTLCIVHTLLCITVVFSLYTQNGVISLLL